MRFLAILILLAAPLALADDTLPADAAPLVAPTEYIVVAPAPVEIHGAAYLCDVSGAGGNVKAGSLSVSMPTLPCEAIRTYEVLDELAERRGLSVATTRVFLHVRLFSRGIFSSIMGLVGLG